MNELLEKGFRDKGESREYLQTLTDGLLKKELVDVTMPLGVKGVFGPLYFETYFSDLEPNIKPAPFMRFIFWQPLTRTKPHGWHLNIFSDEQYQHGIAILDQEAYFKDWSSHAKRHRNKWLRDDEHEIVEVDLQAYADAYHASKKLEWLTRTGFVRVLKYHIDRHPSNVHLLAARRKDTKAIVAGLAVIDYKDISQSIHTSAFIHPSVQKTSVGVGLIDRWHILAQTNGIRFLNFGIVWREGNPKEWKGYSAFKQQFNLTLIRYPRPFIKIVWAKKEDKL